MKTNTTAAFRAQRIAGGGIARRDYGRLRQRRGAARQGAATQDRSRKTPTWPKATPTFTTTATTPTRRMKFCRSAIYPEINVSYETTNANASPAIYFDSYGHAVVPLLGGIAIRDIER